VRTVVYRRVAQILQRHAIAVYRSWIGSYVTTQDMAGFALAFCRVDGELKRLYDAPAAAPYFAQC